MNGKERRDCRGCRLREVDHIGLEPDKRGLRFILHDGARGLEIVLPWGRVEDVAAGMLAMFDGFEGRGSRQWTAGGEAR